MGFFDSQGKERPEFVHPLSISGDVELEKMGRAEWILHEGNNIGEGDDLLLVLFLRYVEFHSVVFRLRRVLLKNKSLDIDFLFFVFRLRFLITIVVVAFVPDEIAIHLLYFFFLFLGLLLLFPHMHLIFVVRFFLEDVPLFYPIFKVMMSSPAWTCADFTVLYHIKYIYIILCYILSHIPKKQTILQFLSPSSVRTQP